QENDIPSPPKPAEEVPAASTVQTAPAAEPISSGSASKRKNPTSDDDEGFVTVQRKKDKR
ncbi:hypothetical protein CEXT_769221, partial [Caerostris extrusa]